jgi:hypothetical protein
MTSAKTLKEAAGEKFDSTVTICGVTVENVTPETLDDFEILETIAVMSDPYANEDEKLRAITSFGPAVFGAKQWRGIKAALREQNGGRLTNATVMEFIGATMAALKAKNA